MTDEELIKRVRHEWTAAGGIVGYGELGKIFDSITILASNVMETEMLDKACKTYCRFCPHQCESYPHDDCQIQIEFRKAMEE